MADELKHSIIKEYRQILNRKCPKFIYLAVYFHWDEGIHSEEIAEMDKKFWIIYDKLYGKGNKTAEDALREEVMGMLPQAEKLYHTLVAELSEEDKERFILSDKVFNENKYKGRDVLKEMKENNLSFEEFLRGDLDKEKDNGS